MKILHPSMFRPNLIKPVLVATGYLAAFFVACVTGTLLRTDTWTSFWFLPSGLSYALLLIWGPAYTPVVFAAVSLALLWIYGLPLTLSLLGLAFLNSAGYGLTALILRRLIGQRPDLSTLRETTYFILGGIFTPATVAAGSIGLLMLVGNIPAELYAASFFKLWVEDVLVNVALAPILVILFNSPVTPNREPSWARRLKTALPNIWIALAQVVCILIALWIVFVLNDSDDRRLWYLFFLPLVWTILQFGMRGAAVANLGISLGSILTVRWSHYPLAATEDLHIFMLMLALTGLVSGAAFNELRRTQQRLHKRLEMEGHITAISTRFINLNLEHVDEEIRAAMQSFSSFCGADGSHLILFTQNGEGRKVSRAFQWPAGGGPSQPTPLDGLSPAALPYVMMRLDAGAYCYFPDIHTMPREASKEREHMERNHLRSLITVPLMFGNRLAGCLGFYSTHQAQIWAEEDIRLLSLLGETFLNVLERQRVENMMRESDRKFRSVILQSHDGILLINERGQVIEWNSGMESITALKRADVLGRMVWDVQNQLALPEIRNSSGMHKLREIIETFQREGGAHWSHHLSETSVLRPDGEKRTMQTVTFPIQTGRGYMVGTIARDVTELRRSEARLEEAERLAHLGHFQIAVPGGQMEWSDETYRIAEWDREDPVPDIKSVLDDIHPEDRQRVLDAIDGALNEKKPFDLEYRIVLHAGRIKYIHTVGQVVTKVDGNVTHIFGTMMDITERHTVLEALRESEARYKDLSDSISDVFFALDNDMLITYWNRASEMLTGIQASKAVGQNLYKLMPNLKGSSVEQFALRAFQARQHQGFVMEYRARGKKIYLEVNTYPFSNGLAVFLQDVTERQAAEERLRQSEARYRAVVEDQTDLICRFTPDGMLTFANEAYCRCYGRPRRELVGHRFLRYTANPDRRDLSGQYTSLVRSKAVTYEYQAVLPDGKLHWLQWTDRPIFNDEGKIVEYQSVGRDISDSKRLEEELRYLSTHDALTGIYNRSFFEAELARLQRGRSWPVSILMVDVNGLKNTNDMRGHPAGDELLKRAANVISACFRPEDIVARFGGDEFAVLLPATDDYAAAEILRRVRASLDAYNHDNGNGMNLSLSIGIATGEKGQSLLEVLTRADTRMYQEKVRQKQTGELGQD